MPQAIAAKCEIELRSVERILGEPVPTACEVAANARTGTSRPGRPSKANAAVMERLRKALTDEPTILATVLLRRAREWGYTGGKSAMSELVKKLRPAPTVEPLVRFEGMPGEYAQFDFGECRVKLTGERQEKVIFFAGRLKYSRFMHVVLVPNQTSEMVVRSSSA